jgi:hypothetical protein
MSETDGSGFGFGSYAKEEPEEVIVTEEMAEEPAAEDTHEFTLEIPAPEPEKVAEAPAPKRAPAPKYELTQRPLRAKKRG